MALDHIRTLHSFRIEGHLSRLSIADKDGNWFQVPLDSRELQTSVQFDSIADALVHLDSGKVIVYAPSRPSPVELELPSTVRIRGHFLVRLKPAASGKAVTIGGRVTSLRYGDAGIGSLVSIEKYGSQMVPSLLEESYKLSLTVVGVAWAFLQLLKVLKDLLAKQP